MGDKREAAKAVARFKLDLLGKLELEMSSARADFEDAARTACRAAGADIVPGASDAFERGEAAWGRVREHSARIEALERVGEIINTVSVAV